jgi:hypothetical protein
MVLILRLSRQVSATGYAVGCHAMNCYGKMHAVVMARYNPKMRRR